MAPFTMELTPTDGRKSFYGKCCVEFSDDKLTLISYGTRIMYRDRLTDELKRYRWMVDGEDWSATTGRHIKAFCGLNKAEYMALPVA